MDFVRGMVVRSKAGRDKDIFFIVLETHDDYVLVADGKYRTLEKPKRKNKKHLARTNKIFSQDDFKTNKQLRQILWPYNYGDEIPVTSAREVI